MHNAQGMHVVDGQENLSVEESGWIGGPGEEGLTG